MLTFHVVHIDNTRFALWVREDVTQVSTDWGPYNDPRTLPRPVLDALREEVQWQRRERDVLRGYAPTPERAAQITLEAKQLALRTANRCGIGYWPQEAAGMMTPTELACVDCVWDYMPDLEWDQALRAWLKRGE
jgi:hypothetical protein